MSSITILLAMAFRAYSEVGEVDRKQLARGLHVSPNLRTATYMIRLIIPDLNQRRLSGHWSSGMTAHVTAQMPSCLEALGP